MYLISKISKAAMNIIHYETVSQGCRTSKKLSLGSQLSDQARGLAQLVASAQYYSGAASLVRLGELTLYYEGCF